MARKTLRTNQNKILVPRLLLLLTARVAVIHYPPNFIWQTLCHMEIISQDLGNKALRKGRHCNVGQIYLVTAVTYQRHDYFRDFFTARTLVHCFRNADEQGKSETMAFVVMPDHFHWLFRLVGQSSLSQVVGAAKGVSSNRLSVLFGGRSIWQRGFYDHAVRYDENLKNIARYVVYNPVRAGLVTRPHDYPHWDARWL